MVGFQRQAGGRDHPVSNKTRPRAQARSSAPQTSDCTSKFLRLEVFHPFLSFRLFMPTYNVNNRLLKSATKMHKLICHRKQRFIPLFFSFFISLTFLKVIKLNSLLRIIKTNQFAINFTLPMLKPMIGQLNKLFDEFNHAQHIFLYVCRLICLLCSQLYSPFPKSLTQLRKGIGFKSAR